MQTSLRNFVHRLLPYVGLVLFGLALWVVHREIEVYHWADIRAAFFSIPNDVLLSMAGFTALGYIALSFYDYLALEYIHEKISYPKAFLASFLSYAVSNTVGHAAISGGSLRYRFYAGWGVSGLSIAKVILFCSFTYIVGSLTLMVLGYFALDNYLSFVSQEVGQTLLLIAVGSAFLLGVWWGGILFYRKPFVVKGLTFTLPTPSLALRQLLVALVDLLLAAMVLYLPLSYFVGLSFQVFLIIYIAAQLVGLFSQVPGGIGVFEGSFLYLMSDHFPSSSVLAALIAYRIVYYFAPLMVAGVLMALYEIRPRRIWQNEMFRSTVGTIRAFTPQVLAVLLFADAFILLLSGVTPGEVDRLAWLHSMLPLPVIEGLHLTASVAGVLMLFLARAVWQRMDAAYYGAIFLLFAGIVASLAKGFDYEEALILCLSLFMFIPSRRHFYRKSALLALNYPPRWMALNFLAIGLAVWAGFYSYRHIPYEPELWLNFSLYGDASRFLRSMLAISAVMCGFFLHLFLMRGNVRLVLPDAEELVCVRNVLRGVSETMTNLALLGDKYLFWSETGRSFVMYDVTPKVWIAMGDPVGDGAEFEELIWRFRERADQYGAQAAFYQVGPTYLPLYIDQGFSLVKLGEEARIPLEAFSLDGRSGRSLRNATHKQEREGLVFSVIPSADVPIFLPALRKISDAWLAAKEGKEKRFSLGFFDETYLKRSDIAVVKKDDTILAFANIWRTEDKNEFSIDLMRYEPNAPNGLMEYLTVQLILMAKEQGYRWFNLGMAPLSGLERRPLSPLWSKIGHTIFRFGNEFYNFEGLYQYKNKYNPVWQPRYLAAPTGFQVASTLLAVMNLISSAPKGVAKK